MADVEHSDITDPFIHEPKGASTANAGEAYVSDGAASGDWTPMETFGEINAFNNRTTSYTLVLSDKGKLIEMDVSTANDLTVPPNASVAFPIGTVIMITQQGAGTTTIVPGSGVTIRSKNSLLSSAGQYVGLYLYKRGTNEWVLLGDLD